MNSHNTDIPKLPDWLPQAPDGMRILITGASGGLGGVNCSTRSPSDAGCRLRAHRGSRAEVTAGSREATEVVPLKRAPRTTGSPRKQLWVERVAGSILRLKSGEENSGRSDVGSTNVARPAFASGASVGSSRGAEGADSIGLAHSLHVAPHPLGFG